MRCICPSSLSPETWVPPLDVLGGTDLKIPSAGLDLGLVSGDLILWNLVASGDDWFGSEIPAFRWWVTFDPDVQRRRRARLVSNSSSSMIFFRLVVCLYVIELFVWPWVVIIPGGRSIACGFLAVSFTWYCNSAFVVHLGWGQSPRHLWNLPSKLGLRSITTAPLKPSV